MENLSLVVIGISRLAGVGVGRTISESLDRLGDTHLGMPGISSEGPAVYLATLVSSVVSRITIQCLSIFAIYGPSLRIMCTSTSDAELTAACSPGALPAPSSTLTASMHGPTHSCAMLTQKSFLRASFSSRRSAQDLGSFGSTARCIREWRELPAAIRRAHIEIQTKLPPHVKRDAALSSVCGGGQLWRCQERQGCKSARRCVLHSPKSRWI
ncbi:hypothetical protein EDB86DRAFT_531769 [Lactarius hatsudake]|nr:hypothetical protein EDB86DRAFT_531769 [Lactarius hatsudake]